MGTSRTLAALRGFQLNELFRMKASEWPLIPIRQLVTWRLLGGETRLGETREPKPGLRLSKSGMEKEDLAGVKGSAEGVSWAVAKVKGGRISVPHSDSHALEGLHMAEGRLSIVEEFEGQRDVRRDCQLSSANQEADDPSLYISPSPGGFLVQDPFPVAVRLCHR
jgi:hypothetical protein